MTPDVEQARAQLRDLLARRDQVDFGMDEWSKGVKPRCSAVLILFGALDRVLARTSVDTVAPELDVLLLKRSDAISHHPGQMAFPGGGREPGDRSPAQTALREAQEETALDPSGVTVLGDLPRANLPHSANQVTPVVGWWDVPIPLSPDRLETDQVFRVPVAEMLDPKARMTSVLFRDGLTHRGPMFVLGPQFGGQVVWGFTAMILDTLFDELGWALPWDPSREYTLP